MNKNELALTALIAPQFYDIHKKIRDSKYSSYWLKGGRGSLKSSFAALQIIIGMVNDEQANALVLRQTAASIRDSVHSTLLWAIDMLGWSEYFESKFSPPEIIFTPTGQKVLMRGLDEPRKLKSIRARKGYIKYLWFEEGEEYNSPEDIRSVKQTVFRGGDSYVEFFSFNPPINPNHWVNKAIQEDDTRRMVHTSCYLDVKEEWLGNEFFVIANQLKKNNYDAYRHEYLGEPVGNPAEVVFSGKYRIEEFSTPALGDIYQNRIFQGADWGFASDPTCLIQCFIMGDSLYIEYESYGYKTELDDIPALFNIIPDAKRWAIKADCSRPETISHVRRKGGFNLSGAPKWENSIIDGIEYIKAFKEIVIHPRCTNLIQEFDNYSYKVDKNTREVLPVLRDSWNHGIDALRYALSSYIKKNISAVDYV